MLRHALHYLTEISVCFILTIPFLAMAQEEVAPSVDQHVVQLRLSSCELSHDELENQRQRLFHRDRQRLEAFKDPIESRRGDYTLERFEQKAETTLQKWPLDHCFITLLICDVLSTANWRERDERSRYLESMGYDIQLRTKYLRRAWKKSREPGVKRLPIHIELELIRKIAGSDWPADISQKFAIIAHGFERLKALIDQDYDVSKLMPLTAPIPKGVPFFVSGMSPSLIEDPELRAEYEQLIAEHEKQVAEHSTQVMLSRHHRCFSSGIAQVLTYLYLEQSPDPDAFPSELGAFLDRYIKDEKIKQTTRSEYLRLLPAYLRLYGGSNKSSQTQRK